MGTFTIRTGSDWPQEIPLGVIGDGLPISQSGLSVGSAQILNFTGAGVSVAVNGVNSNQIDVTIPGGGGGVVAGFGITVLGATVSVNTAAVFTGANAWTGDHRFNAVTSFAGTVGAAGTPDINFVKELAHTIRVANSTTLTIAGGALTVTSANGATGLGATPGGAGGALNLSTGAGGFPGAASAGGAGGALNAICGSGTIGGGAGGALDLESGTGGPGNATHTGGASGTVVLLSRTGGAGTLGNSSGASGSVTISVSQAGTNLGGGAGAGGTLSILGALGRDGVAVGAFPNGTAGGAVIVSARAGGVATGIGASGAGGPLSLFGGAGGGSGSAGGGAAGGPVNVIAGSGGSGGAIAGQTPGAGAPLTCKAGDAGTFVGVGAAAGGDLLCEAGFGSGVGFSGTINIGTIIARTVNIGRTTNNSTRLKGGEMFVTSGTGAIFVQPFTNFDIDGGTGFIRMNTAVNYEFELGGVTWLLYSGAFFQLTLAGSFTLTSTSFGVFGVTATQQVAGGGTAGFVANVSANAVYNESTWTGNTGASAYTLTDIVFALKNYGLLTA